MEAPLAVKVAVWPAQIALKPLTLTTGRGVTDTVIGVDVTLQEAELVFTTL